MRTSQRIVLATLLTWGVIGFETGCPGSLDASFFETTSVPGAVVGATDDASVACPDVPTTFFATTCALAGCHAATSPQAGLDLASPGVAGRLVGRHATGGGWLVDLQSPASSVLYEKLGDAPPFGARMPFGAPALDPDATGCVLSWIESLSPSSSPDAQIADGTSAAPPADDTAGDGASPAQPEAASLAQPAWTPANLQRTVLWLDASQKVTTSAGHVTAWGDLSSSHNDAAADPSTAPTLLAQATNGAPALRFDETKGQFVVIPDAPSLQWGTGGFLVAVVAANRKQTAGRGHGGGLSTVFAKPHMSGSVEIAVHLNFFTGENTDDTSTFHFGIGEGQPGIISSTSGYNDGVPRLYVARMSTAGGQMDMEVRVNGVTAGTTHSNQTTDVTLAGSPVRIGSTYGQNVNGDVAEVIAVEGTVANADLSQLERYLTSKYALTE